MDSPHVGNQVGGESEGQAASGAPVLTLQPEGGKGRREENMRGGKGLCLGVEGLGLGKEGLGMGLGLGLKEKPWGLGPKGCAIGVCSNQQQGGLGEERSWGWVWRLGEGTPAL